MINRPAMREIILGIIMAVLAPAGLHGGETAPAGRKALETYVATLDGEHREAGTFLLEYLPSPDAQKLTVELFRENLEQAFEARRKYPWTKALGKDLFFNDVLPHALVNETRDPWRKRLRELFDPQLADCKTVRDAAGVVGSEIGKLSGVKYDTNREKACQSPAESMRQGMASCTGLSILAVDALRAVGVPARLVAIPLWGTKEGNHTWVEIQDGEGWQMTGFGGTPDRWNKGWEIARCAYSDPAEPITGIYASSYRKTDIGFPTIWDWRSSRRGARPSPADVCRAQTGDGGALIKLEWGLQRLAVPGIDRTAHYLKMAGGRKAVIPKGMASVPIRAYLKGTQTRVDVPVRVLRGEERIFDGRTASESQDLNDLVRIVCPPGTLKIEYRKAGGEWTAIEIKAGADQETPVEIEIPEADAAGIFSVKQRQKPAPGSARTGVQRGDPALGRRS